MLSEGNRIPKGWPLGLGSMTYSTIAASPPAARVVLRSASFSSFTSSNLDTQSSASFFPDQSVSLGRLIGITNVSKGSFVCSEHRKVVADHESRHSGVHDKSQGLCAPFLHRVIRKKGRNGNSSRH